MNTTRFPNRRLLTTLALALMALLVLPACSTERMITIGIVNSTPTLNPVIDGFEEGMAALGWREGENIRFLYDGATTDANQLEPAIQAFLDQKVDLLLVVGTPTTRAAKKLTAGTDNRVVFASVLDPIAAGVVTEAEIRRRDSNLTGIRHGVHEGKRLEWCERVAPDAKTWYAPFNPNDAAAVRNVEVMKESAAKLGLTVLTLPTENPDAVKTAVLDIPAETDGLLLLADGLVTTQLPLFVEQSLKLKLPLCVPNVTQVDVGGLLSYGFDFQSLGRQSSRLVDQVLKGIAPGDLPIETAEFALVINQWVANQIGISIPESILRQADRIVYVAPATVSASGATPAPTSAPTHSSTNVPTAIPTTEPTSAPTATADTTF